MNLATPVICIERRQLFTFNVGMARVHGDSKRTIGMTKSPPTVAVESLRDNSDDNERTQNVLVHLTDTDADEQLVCEARAYAAGVGGHLVLLSVMPSCEFAERRRAYAQIRDLPEYTLPMAMEKHRRSAERSGRSVLNSLDIEYTAVGAVGHESDQVLATAKAYNCGYVFLVDRPRSLLRRLTGDSIRAIARGFDGSVITLQDPNHL